MPKFYIVHQTPTVELEVTCKDSTGIKETMVVGFNRYNAEDSEKLLERFSVLVKEGLDLAEIQEKTEIDKDLLRENRIKYNALISTNIVYYKKVTVKIPKEKDPNSFTKYTIEDTRTLPESSPVYDIDIKDILDEQFLGSTPWRFAISSAFQNALINVEFETDKAKTKN